MTVISKTPLRISLFGGGTDYPAYYLRKKGAILGFTIDQFIYVSVQKKGKFFQDKIRLGYGESEMVENIADIKHPSIRACLQYFNLTKGIEIHIFSDLPAKTGLGSSSSFTVGLVHALFVLQKKSFSKQELAETACYIEQNILLENVGSQDQFHAAYGGWNVFEFSSEKIEVIPLHLSPAQTQMLQSHMMIFYTNQTRYAHFIAKEQIEKTKKLINDPFLHAIHQIVYKAKKLFSSTQEKMFIRKIGELLHQSWCIKKELSTKISNPSIDDAYRIAYESGAIGGKLCGAGGGGFLIFIVPPEKQENVRNNLAYLTQVEANMTNEGSTIIYKR